MPISYRFALILFSLAVALSFRLESAQAHQEIGKKVVLVVRPKAWDEALGEWTKYRSVQYEILKVDSVASPYELRQSILRTVTKAKKPIAAILLCGDVFGEPNPQKPAERPETITPTFEIPTTVKLGPFTTPTLATDVYYGDVDGRRMPRNCGWKIARQDPSRPVPNAQTKHRLRAIPIIWPMA